MVVIKFPDIDTQDEGVGFLGCHFTVRLLRSGEVIDQYPIERVLNTVTELIDLVRRTV